MIEAILDSKFVILGSLHGLIIAEAYGIPARALREDISMMISLFGYSMDDKIMSYGSLNWTGKDYFKV